MLNIQNALNVEVSIKEWVKPVLDDISDSINKRSRDEISHKVAIELVNEIAEKVVKHGIGVNGPIYINPYPHHEVIIKTSLKDGEVNEEN